MKKKKRNSKPSERIKQVEDDLLHYRKHLDEMVKERVEKILKEQENLFITKHLAVLGKLARNISHEFRDPLNVISTSAYYLRAKLADADEKIINRIKSIETEVGKSVAIIEALLSLSGMREPRKGYVNLGTALNDAVSDSKIPDTIELVKDICSKEIFIEADEEQLNIAFTGIIKNAMDAMGNKGKLSLSVKMKNDKKIEISFMDTSGGAAAENADKVFEPLFTAEGREFGFGLSVCKFIVEKHSGKIEIKSEAGKGSTVTLTFPHVQKNKDKI